MKTLLKVRGFARVQLGEDGKVVGDSGWVENEIMDLGYSKFLCGAPAADASSLQIGAIALGTGGVPNVTDTALPGETRRGGATVTVESSKTIQGTVAFASGTAGGNISNIAMLNSTASAGTICCGITYASSAWASNQAVSATYQLQYQTTS